MNLLTIWMTFFGGLVLLLCLAAGDRQISLAFSENKRLSSVNQKLKKHSPPFWVLVCLLLVLGLVFRLWAFFAAPGPMAQEQMFLTRMTAVLQTGKGPEGFAWWAFYPSDQAELTGPLMTWLCLPLQWLCGESIRLARLPLLVLSLLSTLALFDMVRSSFSKDAALWTLLICALSPWLIFQTNLVAQGTYLLPHLVILIFWMLLRERHAWCWRSLALLLFGLCMYTGDAAWYIVPLLFLFCAGLLIYQKKVRVLQAVLGLLIFLLLSLPAFATWAVNLFDFPQSAVSDVNIERVPYAHTEDPVWRQSWRPVYQDPDPNQRILPIREVIYNRLTQTLHRAIQYSLFQNVDEAIGYDPLFGMIYVFSLPLTLLGGLSLFIAFVRKQKNGPSPCPSWVKWMAASVICCLPLILLHRWLTAPHYALLVYPLMLCTVAGIRYVTKRIPLSGALLASLYVIGAVVLMIV